jgi:MFS family permease
LITGALGPLSLYVGRFLTGVVAGVVFAVGTAWVKELSAEAVPGAGARRAAISLSAGFGAGPLASGFLAQWAPHPEVVPYLIPLALAGAALLVLFGSPETAVRVDRSESLLSRLRIPARARPRFRTVVMPMAPWVFGSISTVFTILPTQVRATGVPVVFAGVLAAVTLGSGIGVQPVARRLDRRGAASGTLAGLLIIIVGYGAAALVAVTGNALLAVLAAVVLGVGYGICLVSGLLEVERLAQPDDLAALVAIYYTLAYFGLAVPYVVSLIAPSTGYPAGLLLAGGLALLSLLVVVVRGRATISTS